MFVVRVSLLVVRLTCCLGLGWLLSISNVGFLRAGREQCRSSYDVGLGELLGCVLRVASCVLCAVSCRELRVAECCCWRWFRAKAIFEKYQGKWREKKTLDGNLCSASATARLRDCAFFYGLRDCVWPCAVPCAV
jgi:hypothetical protein